MVRRLAAQTGRHARAGRQAAAPRGVRTARRGADRNPRERVRCCAKHQPELEAEVRPGGDPAQERRPGLGAPDGQRGDREPGIRDHRQQSRPPAPHRGAGAGARRPTGDHGHGASRRLAPSWPARARRSPRSTATTTPRSLWSPRAPPGGAPPQRASGMAKLSSTRFARPPDRCSSRPIVSRPTRGRRRTVAI